jgi:hypothetical protein
MLKGLKTQAGVNGNNEGFFFQQDIKTFLDEAPDGVVYFSMGSNLQSSEMPEEKKQAFLETFSKLKQRVLWKWETDSLPGQPSNVKLGKWLPQSDILGKKKYIYIYLYTSFNVVRFHASYAECPGGKYRISGQAFLG